MDWFEQDRVRVIVIKKGSQSGGTEALINLLAWPVDPAPGLPTLISPHIKSAGDKNVTRILPQLLATPPTAARLSPRAHDRKARYIRFDRMYAYFRGAFSEHQLESDPCRYVLCDELDRCPPRTAHLALQRIKTFSRGKAVYNGKPGLVGQGIDLEYSKGSRRTYRVPCPRCGAYHERTFRDIRWAGTDHAGKPSWDTHDVAADVAHAKATSCSRCPACRGRIGPELNHWQLSLGVWAAPDQRVTRLRRRDGGTGLPPGFCDQDPHLQPHALALHETWEHTPGLLIGPDPATDIESVEIPEWISGVIANPYAPAVEGYLHRKGVIDADWLADHAGKAWSQTTGAVEISSLRERCTPVPDGGYRLGEVPAGVLALLAACDLQDDRAYIVVRGLTERCQKRYLVWHGAVPLPIFGDFSPLLAALFRRFRRQGSPAEVPIGARVIDSGDGEVTQAVYDFCRGRHLTFPSKGVGLGRGRRAMDKVYQWSSIDTDRQGRPLANPTRLLRLNTLFLKSAVMRRLQIRPGSDTYRPGIDDGPEISVLGDQQLAAAVNTAAPTLFFPEDTGEDYFHQLTAEECLVTTVHGRREYTWQLREGRTDNHYFDCEVMLDALEAALRLPDLLVGGRTAPTPGAPPPARPDAPAPTLRALSRAHGILASTRRKDQPHGP